MPGEPLIVTEDPDLAEELAGIAAAAGCETRRVAEADAVGRAWHEAPLVLLDVRALRHCLAAGLPPRPGLVLVTAEAEPEFWRTAFHGGAQYAMELASEEQRLVGLLTELTEETASGEGRLLAVLGGRGGAGASVLAAVTAVLAARTGRSCTLLDCDALGGGLDLVLGEEHASGLRWPELSVGSGRFTVAALREALPSRRLGSGEIATLSCAREKAQHGMTSESVRAVLDAARRAGQTVVCDLPRTRDETTLAVLRRADLTVMVVPAEIRACAAATGVLNNLGDAVPGPVRAVVRGPAPGGLRVADVQRAVGLEVLTTMRTDRGLPALVDRFGLCGVRLGGHRPPVRAARKLLRALDGIAEKSVRTGDSR
ncbi:septum formation initiator [Actinopolyspora erythraea]|uniref:Septum formation initiator n=1 Tax=Actinopolyspora erythraea TaxID=414996 RepID=A0A099DAC2_9ACTN|nr:septum site-determining protein Ssd [Actinopolyspora erythraea]ASU77194.1 septum formation initiator [Actinopolyspora erythraea]KGI83113.1 septum formation initiator [Actinopolyspora erythraea]